MPHPLVQPVADALDLDLLEPLLMQMVGLIGVQATLAIVERHGGTLLYIPRQADQNEALVALIGREKAAILGREFGPERRLIPKALPALLDLRNQAIRRALQTRSVRQVARDWRLGERMVWYIKSGGQLGRDEPTGDLFAADDPRDLSTGVHPAGERRRRAL